MVHGATCLDNEEAKMWEITTYILVGTLIGYCIGVCRMFAWMKQYLGIDTDDSVIIKIILKRLSKRAQVEEYQITKEIPHETNDR